MSLGLQSRDRSPGRRDPCRFPVWGGERREDLVQPSPGHWGLATGMTFQDRAPTSPAPAWPSQTLGVREAQGAVAGREVPGASLGTIFGLLADGLMDLHPRLTEWPWLHSRPGPERGGWPLPPTSGCLAGSLCCPQMHTCFKECSFIHSYGPLPPALGDTKPEPGRGLWQSPQG